MRVNSCLAIFFALIATLLLGLNISGLFLDIRPANLAQEPLRFENDLALSREQAFIDVEKRTDESEEDYIYRLPGVIAQSIAHVPWNEEPDATRYHQLVPAWENYILYLMGVFSGIPEYEKYHFANYKRSINRGIGICGDASMILSQLLDKNQIPNQIISFPGHVVVAAKIASGQQFFLDADFGVVVPDGLDDVFAHPELVSQYYADKGYSHKEITWLEKTYGKEHQRWDGVSHFITKKYYFEKFAYVAKWLFPLLLLMISAWLWRSRAKP